MTGPEKITGIVLAGGKSRRMGQDKGLVDFNGKRLVQYAIETLKPVCGKILLSANRVEDYRQFGYEVVRDEIQEIGPMGGILTCLKKSETQHNLVLSCDTPFIDGELFQALLKKIEINQVVVPVHHQNKYEPLAAYYATNVIAEMNKCVEAGDYKMMNFLNRVRTGTVIVEDVFPGRENELFRNLNRPEDLQ